MDQSNNGSKKSFKNSKMAVLLLYAIIFVVTIVALYSYFNFIPSVSERICFKSLGMTFGCNPYIMQKGQYYEANTEINLADEFIITQDGEVSFYVKKDNQYVPTVSFSEEGEHLIELYVNYFGKITKHERIIKIGDATPPSATQKEVPILKIGEVLSFEDYLDIKDNRDPNPFILGTSIIVDQVGEFTVDVTLSDNHNNTTRIPFTYQVVE